MNENRDEATGQFTPSTEGLYGREAELVAAGFTVKNDEPKSDGKTYSDDLAGVQEAARELAERRASGEPLEVPVDVVREHRGKPDIKEAATPEQAAAELSSVRGDVSKYVEGANLMQFAAEVDKARAEELKRNPRAAEDLGLSAEDVEAAKNADKSETVGEPKPAKEATTSTVEGLDPEVERALKHPQVRQAIEEEFGKAEAAKQDYSNALQTANQFAMASLVDHFPELAGLPVQNWEAALNIFAQQAPERFHRAMGTLERVGQLQTAQAQWQQHEARQRAQRFQAYKAEQDSVFEKTIANEKPERLAEIVETVAQYAEEFGISRAQLKHLSDSNEIMRHAAFQSMMADAARYRLIQKAGMTVRAQPLPPVSRPGVATNTRPATDNSAKIAALQQQLEGATGQKAARLAGQIRSLKRAS